MTEFWIQTSIVTSSLLVVWLIASKSRGWRVFGFIFGIVVCQPLWIMETYWHRQWGLLTLSVAYLLVYARGVWNNRKPNLQPPASVVQSDHVGAEEPASV